MNKTSKSVHRQLQPLKVASWQSTDSTSCLIHVWHVEPILLTLMEHLGDFVRQKSGPFLLNNILFPEYENRDVDCVCGFLGF